MPQVGDKVIPPRSGMVEVILRVSQDGKEVDPLLFLLGDEPPTQLSLDESGLFALFHNDG